MLLRSRAACGRRQGVPGRRVTPKAPLGPTWKEGQAGPKRRPQPFSRILTAWRGCMKSGSRVVFRYSSTHVKEIPDRSFRRRMEIHRASPARPQRAWTAQDPRSSRDPQRHLLPAEERMSVAHAASRLPSLAHRLSLLQDLAHRVGTWERINRSLLERLRLRLKRDPQPSAGVVDSQGRSRAPR